MTVRTAAAILAAVLCAAVPRPAAAEPGEAMTHMVFRFVAEGLDPDSFAATPREMWRVGATHFRLAEEPNPTAGVQTLLIKNAPETWLVDLLTGEARHAVYDGEDSEIQVPMFAGIGGEALLALEYGRELAFFRERGAKRAGSGIIGGRHATALVLVIDGIQLTLYVGDDGQPWQVAIDTGRQEWAIRYETYETGLDPDWSLFRPPEGVTVLEME